MDAAKLETGVNLVARKGCEDGDGDGTRGRLQTMRQTSHLTALELLCVYKDSEVFGDHDRQPDAGACCWEHRGPSRMLFVVVDRQRRSSATGLGQHAKVQRGTRTWIA